jgi:hypothetical protein
MSIRMTATLSGSVAGSFHKSRESGTQSVKSARQARTAASHMRVRHNSSFRQVSCKSLVLVLSSCEGLPTASRKHSTGCAVHPIVLALGVANCCSLLPFISHSQLRFRHLICGSGSAEAARSGNRASRGQTDMSDL